MDIQRIHKGPGINLPLCHGSILSAYDAVGQSLSGGVGDWTIPSREFACKRILLVSAIAPRDYKGLARRICCDVLGNFSLHGFLTRNS